MTLPSLSDLLGHHIALTGEVMSGAPGITWIWARDGIYKRGQDAVRDVTVLVNPTPPTPGLTALLPGIAWRGLTRRLPGQLLTAMLAHARKAMDEGRPIEQQYHVTLEAGQVRVRVPHQDATPGRVTYAPPVSPVLLDLHSHHGMPAFFSATDDADDTGLGVSVVIGRIFGARPAIAARLCCYGHTQRVPTALLFDHLGPFRDTYGERHASA
jgi:PRTRC genetic system protein A